MYVLFTDLNPEPLNPKPIELNPKRSWALSCRCSGINMRALGCTGFRCSYKFFRVEAPNFLPDAF